MDPITGIALGSQLFGTAMSLFGGVSAMDTSKKIAGLSSSNAQLQMQEDQQRNKMMELTARRQQKEVIRNQQRAHSMALTSATGQGAQYGSGLQGGFGQISGASQTQALGINQNLAIGRNLFGLNQQIDQNKIQMAQYGGDLATAQGFQSLGGSLVKAGPVFGQLGGNLFGSSPQGGEGRLA